MSVACTIAFTARLREITGQTYQRYSPAARVWSCPASTQRTGIVMVGRFVSCSKTFDPPRNNSTWYAEARGSGAQANLCGSGLFDDDLS